MKVMIIPGAMTKVSQIWIPYVKSEMESLGLEVIAENMPDPILTRRDYWLPFIEEKLNGDRESILVGHSSGSVAILRYLESHRIEGSVIIGAHYTHGNDAREKASGYFDSEWLWDDIRKNSNWITQFASIDDPYIPIEEPRFIRDKLQTHYVSANGIKENILSSINATFSQSS